MVLLGTGGDSRKKEEEENDDGSNSVVGVYEVNQSTRAFQKESE